jgi:glycosyltransferase involved in cell wall biosynthesis
MRSGRKECWMRPERMLFVLSRVLGGKTFSSHIQRAAEALGIEGHYVFLDESDYGSLRGRIPRWQRATGLFLGPAILRHKLRAQPIPPCDAVFLQSFEILPALSAIDPALPVVLAHDSTNVLSYRLLRDVAPSPVASLRCALKSMLVTPAYRPWLRRVRAFLPRTHWCAGSLVRDFGVDPDRIVVTPAGIDLERWKPAAPGPTRDLPVLLFVGNDFERKGGRFLLDLFTGRLKGKARLRIISNDPALKDRIWPADVEHLSGLGHGNPQELVEAYRASDIFVFPTRKEHLGMVTTEACAAGLPLVATDVGGVREAVETGMNGLLVPFQAGAEEWSEALLRLIDDPDLRARMGAESRRRAERKFGFDSFLRNVEAALAMLAGPAAGNEAPLPVDTGVLAA